MAFMLGATAQDRTINGRVVNDKGTALEAVSVVPSDGKNGTQTDKDGNYSLSVSAATKSLIFSSVNLKP